MVRALGLLVAESDSAGKLVETRPQLPPRVTLDTRLPVPQAVAHGDEGGDPEALAAAALRGGPLGDLECRPRG